MNTFSFLKLKNIRIIFTLFLIIGFIFLSGLKFQYFQFRFLILLLLLPCLYKFYNDFKKKDYYFLVSFLLLLFLLSLHLGINIYFENSKLTNYTLFGFIFFLSIYAVSYYYADFINQNINLIINLFLFIFFVSCMFSILNYRPDAPFFCGGISNFMPSDTLLEQYGHRIRDLRLSFRELIFPENSHLGMIAPGIIAYSVYRSTNKKNSKIEIFSLCLFIIICFIKSSTTLLLGIFLSLTLILLFNHKQINKKTLISLIILIVFSLSILLLSKECRSRFVPIYGLGISNKTLENKTNSVVGKINKNLAYKIENILRTSGNLSSGVVYRALFIAKKSLIEKPFGWGLNRYDQAFDYFNNLEPSKNPMLNRYNNKDGANNFNKLIVEFGIFGLIIYLFIFLFLINKKISIELKLFYFPFILTQSLRGAGYFNGGFSLILLLMLFTFIKIYKKAE